MARLTDRPDMTLDVYRGRKTTHHTITGAFGSVPNWIDPDQSSHCSPCNAFTCKLCTTGGIRYFYKKNCTKSVLGSLFCDK